jgi:hypothetical protein
VAVTAAARLARASAGALLVLGLAARLAAAQAPDPAPSPAPAPAPAPAPMPAPAPPATPADALREANAAAAAGDWPRVTALVEPVLRVELPPADRAEAYRLSGMAAYYQGRRDIAEAHFLAYLKIDLDGRLDPALYPPEVVGFFDEVRTKHQADLRALRPKARRYWLLNLVPPGGQIQNGHRGKAWVIGSLLGVLAIGNITTYAVLSSWCTRVRGPGGSSVTCDEGQDHARGASQLRAINLLTGIGLVGTYLYGVYDGASNYRRKESAQPFVAPIPGGGLLGIGGAF